MHVRERRALQDTLTAIRLKTTVAQAGHALLPNGERHLRPLATLERIYPAAWLAETLAIAGRCTFSLDDPALRISRRDRAAREKRRPVICAGSPRTASRGAFRREHTRRQARQGAQADRTRTRADRRATLRAVLPDGVRRRQLRAQAGHPLPGPRLGGELGGVLLPRHHRGRSVAHGNAVRALHFARAQRAARTSTSISSTSGAKK